MEVKLEDILHDFFATYNPNTGANKDADSLPTIAVYEEGTGTAMTVTSSVTNVTTGMYRWQVSVLAADGFETGKYYSVWITATVTGTDTVTQSAPVMSFRATTNVGDDIYADVALIKAKTDYLPSATPGASGGVIIVGTNSAAVEFTGGMTISSTTGDALALTSTGGNGVGLVATGNNGGAGIRGQGGTTGPGILGIGGATSGAGIRGTGQNNSQGIVGLGNGTGAGIQGSGGVDGPGMWAYGGTTSGDGIKATGNGTGVDIRGDIVGNVTGTVSGNSTHNAAAVLSALGTGTWATAIPWNASWDAEVQSEVQDAIEVNHLDHLLATAYDPASKPGAADALLNELIGDDAGVSQFTVNALELAPAGGGGGGGGDAEQATLLEVQSTINELSTNLSGTPIVIAPRVTGGVITAYIGDDYRVRSGSQLSIPVVDVGSVLYDKITDLGVGEFAFGASRDGRAAGEITGTIASATYALGITTIVVEITDCGSTLSPCSMTYQIQSTTTQTAEYDDVIEVSGILKLKQRTVSPRV